MSPDVFLAIVLALQKDEGAKCPPPAVAQAVAAIKRDEAEGRSWEVPGLIGLAQRTCRGPRVHQRGK